MDIYIKVFCDSTNTKPDIAGLYLAKEDLAQLYSLKIDIMFLHEKYNYENSDFKIGINIEYKTAFIDFFTSKTPIERDVTTRKYISFRPFKPDITGNIIVTLKGIFLKYFLTLDCEEVFSNLITWDALKGLEHTDLLNKKNNKNKK